MKLWEKVVKRGLTLFTSVPTPIIDLFSKFPQSFVYYYSCGIINKRLHLVFIRFASVSVVVGWVFFFFFCQFFYNKTSFHLLPCCILNLQIKIEDKSL